MNGNSNYYFDEIIKFLMYIKVFLIFISSMKNLIIK